MKRLIGILLFAIINILHIPSAFANEKLVVLTFDDGPKPGILLGEKGHMGLVGLLESSFGKFIPAHFFVIGGEAQANQKLIETLSKKGFFIENHTYGHDNLLRLKVEDNYNGILKTIQETDSVIIKATGRYPKYFRPPYWAIDADLKEFINSKFYYSHKVVYLENPDINTLDYDDHSKKRSPAALIAGRGYSFGTLDDFFENKRQKAENNLNQRPVKSVYLSIDHLYNQKKIEYIFSLFDDTELSAVVIDFKVDKTQVNQYVKELIARFHQRGIYVIGRLVMFQDSYLAKSRPNLAIRNKNGEMCFSGKKVWQRYWVDMASSEVIEYNIKIAKQGIDMGFDEINFDYIRFPSDLKNCNLKNDIVYPYWNGQDKYQTMRQVFSDIKEQLKNYARKNNANVVLSVDIFGEVFAYGSEPGIGQKLSDIAEFFDVISPMAYPSHYQCQAFGFKDPNAHPYVVYNRTLEPGLEQLKVIIFKGEVRPWIQDFSISNIYGCGPVVYYGQKEISAQIKASKDLGLTGFMLWNAANNYTKKALLR